jgi:formylglycine-generating enzyme required for sulfatase activity
VDAGICQAPVDTRWYKVKKFANDPVVYVNWHQAVSYAKWRSSVSGIRYQLPAEREWEYAARGVSNLIYPWGNEFISDNLVFVKNSGESTNEVITCPGGKSWVGAMHLSGNVWEWCSSVYEPNPYNCVVRGGSWDFFSSAARSANRSGGPPDYRSQNIGFRLVCSVSLLLDKSAVSRKDNVESGENVSY